VTLLKATEMSGGYGGADILKNCTIEVDRGEIVVIVGPNGAGKSTAMKAIFGMIDLHKGSIQMNGVEISKIAPQQRVRHGMAFVPQSNNVFHSLTVEENLEMGAFLRRDNITKSINEVFKLFPVLRKKRQQIAGELSGGQRQQLAFGRALMTNPTLLMLDEPTAGVSPNVMDELFNRILEIKEAHIAILIVEQNARQALSIADRGYVLVNGENRHTGSGKTLLANSQVRRSFLGG
tara:strand:+ start:2419 stop:3123 length:705 start_codon:yes stop_codon:yes gene_type:complete